MVEEVKPNWQLATLCCSGCAKLYSIKLKL